MTITVRYFASLKELTGKESERLPVAAITVNELLQWVDRTYEGFADYASSTLVAVNEEYAQHDDQIQSGDVAALIPPVSGG